MAIFGNVRQETLGRDNVLATFRGMPVGSDTARGFWGSVMQGVGSMGEFDLRRDYATMVRALGKAWRVNRDDDAKRLYDAMLEYLE